MKKDIKKNKITSLQNMMKMKMNSLKKKWKNLKTIVYFCSNNLKIKRNKYKCNKMLQRDIKMKYLTMKRNFGITRLIFIIKNK